MFWPGLCVQAYRTFPQPDVIVLMKGTYCTGIWTKRVREMVCCDKQLQAYHQGSPF